MAYPCGPLKDTLNQPVLPNSEFYWFLDLKLAKDELSSFVITGVMGGAKIGHIENARKIQSQQNDRK